MIIKFSKDIELTDWTDSVDDIAPQLKSVEAFHRVYCNQDKQCVIGVSVRKLTWAKLIVPNYERCSAMFYHDLTFCHNCFPSSIEGSLDFAKDYVDKFLIRMTGLRAFS